MKKLLLASLAGVFLTTGSVFAADLATPAPVYKAPPPPPVPAVSWTGCYIDGGAGYGLFNQDHSTTFTGGVFVTTTDGGRGWLGRFGGGCDYQTPLFDNRLVVGVFGDYDFMSLTGSNTPDVRNMATGSPSTFPTKETDAAYAGGRIGYLVNPTLLTYVDGGWTATHFSNSPVITTAFGGATGTGWPNYSPDGWFLGGGYEYALNFDWLPIHGLFWRTEYRFSQYNNSDIRIFTIATGVPGGDVEHVTPYVQTITSSLVWRFNFGGPIATAESGPAPAYKAPPAPPPPAVGWTGCYVDAGGGYGLWNEDHSTTTAGSGTTVPITDAGRGWLGRVGAGCDYQTPLFNNRVVAGVFGDYDFMSLTGSNSPELFSTATDTTVTFNAKETNAVYIGGRVGYLVTPSLLSYADGGYTQTHFDPMTLFSTVAAIPLPTPPSVSGQTYNGWFLGGGAEYALSGIVPINGLFWRSEYRLASYNKSDAQFITASGAPGANVEHITPYVQTVASGLVWRFNFGGPIATRY